MKIEISADTTGMNLEELQHLHSQIRKTMIAVDEEQDKLYDLANRLIDKLFDYASMPNKYFAVGFRIRETVKKLDEMGYGWKNHFYEGDLETIEGFLNEKGDLELPSS